MNDPERKITIKGIVIALCVIAAVVAAVLKVDGWFLFLFVSVLLGMFW